MYRSKRGYRRRYNRRRYGRRAVARYGQSTNRSTRMVQGTIPKIIYSLPYLARTVSNMASLINSEPHFYDVPVGTPQPVSTAGYMAILTDMGIGDTDITRTGNKILGKDIYIRGTLSLDPDVIGTQVATIRLMLVCDKEYDNASPSISDILQYNTNPLSPVNQEEGKRFVIMKSYTMVLNSQRPSVPFKIYKKVPWHLFYNGASQGPTTAKENQLLLVAVSNISAATDPPLIDFLSRFKWYDN